MQARLYLQVGGGQVFCLPSPGGILGSMEACGLGICFGPPHLQVLGI